EDDDQMEMETPFLAEVSAEKPKADFTGAEDDQVETPETPFLTSAEKPKADVSGI
ncbi:unnamed protein product, partial [Durusdinium trenchii]